MRIIKNNLKKLLIAILIVITVFNFVMVPRAKANWLGDIAENIGGMLSKLIWGVVDLTLDSIVGLMQKMMMGESFWISYNGDEENNTGYDKALEKGLIEQGKPYTKDNWHKEHGRTKCLATRLV